MVHYFEEKVAERKNFLKAKNYLFISVTANSNSVVKMASIAASKSMGHHFF